MNIFWKVRMKFLFHMKVNKPSAIISKRVFDLHILNQWNGRIKVPVFLMGIWHDWIRKVSRMGKPWLKPKMGIVLKLA